MNCEDVCQVTFIVVILNATKYCNKRKAMDWECGLEELTRNFSYKLNSIDMSNSTRTYSIRNPVESQEIWLPCTGSAMTKCNRLNQYFNKFCWVLFVMAFTSAQSYKKCHAYLKKDLPFVVIRNFLKKKN